AFDELNVALDLAGQAEAVERHVVSEHQIDFGGDVPGERCRGGFGGCALHNDVGGRLDAFLLLLHRDPRARHTHVAVNFYGVIGNSHAQVRCDAYVGLRKFRRLKISAGNVKLRAPRWRRSEGKSAANADLTVAGVRRAVDAQSFFFRHRGDPNVVYLNAERGNVGAAVGELYASTHLGLRERALHRELAI